MYICERISRGWLVTRGKLQTYALKRNIGHRAQLGITDLFASHMERSLRKSLVVVREVYMIDAPQGH